MKPGDVPKHLEERIRPLGEDAGTVSGEFVLYWMHHAVRAEENPALDTAKVAAAALDLPLLVYQGLGGRHPYDSDRHHTFSLEGARDVAAALAAQDMRHVFHLAVANDTPSPLRDLARRAALVVTEDFPAPPLPGWVRALAHRTPAPIWQVDTACVLPMKLVNRAFSRAYEFRRAHGEEQLRRARAPWPAVDASAPPFQGRLGFEPVGLAAADIPALCAACEIDHSVGPVPDSRGGIRAGAARWSEFLENGLASYHRLRNDAAVAPPRGVSRISPYLHHGQLSPLRVAREAAFDGGGGSQKFLDELLIWRELAHNFCFHHEHLPGGLACLDRLPEWAQRSLRAHEPDPRSADFDWERLARGETGDPLWDAAQRSLLIHGELHNNLRMSWGKAFLGWTRSPERALRLMIDLNHRYALDGSDPNSYGGLLYCLGLFDRPFSPAQPVFGAVRTRSTRAHARRLDLGAYRDRANTRRTCHLRRVAVVGAGIAGLAAARTLTGQGFEVKVLERGRGVGGRTAHRRSEGHYFDHGAQYFTVRDPRFARHVAAWTEAGLVAPWTGRIVTVNTGGTTSPSPPLERYVGVPGMNAVAKHMARGVDVVTDCHVTELRRAAGVWHVDTAAGEALGPFDALILAVPPEQASPLSMPPGLLEAVDAVESLPCWCAMAAFAESLPVDFDGAFVSGTPLDWIARDSSKPGRPPGERWTIHANPRWSAGRLTEPPDEVARELIGHFFAALGLAPFEPVHLTGHRWSFARPAREADLDCVWQPEQTIAMCGDWCRGGRVEGAYLSGVAAAGRVVGNAIDSKRPS